jgi:hypothetical protein
MEHPELSLPSEMDTNKEKIKLTAKQKYYAMWRNTSPSFTMEMERYQIKYRPNQILS